WAPRASAVSLLTPLLDLPAAQMAPTRATRIRSARARYQRHKRQRSSWRALATCGPFDGFLSNGTGPSREEVCQQHSADNVGQDRRKIGRCWQVQERAAAAGRAVAEPALLAVERRMISRSISIRARSSDEL